MRICDICRQVTQQLEVLPGDLGHAEVCAPCHRRLLDLFDACEQEVTLPGSSSCGPAIEKWKAERVPGAGD